MIEPAAYAAEYYSPSAGHVLCYGIGTTRQAAMASASQQFVGAPRYWQAYMRGNITLRPLSADEASEVAEMLATPWSAGT